MTHSTDNQGVTPEHLQNLGNLPQTPTDQRKECPTRQELKNHYNAGKIIGFVMGLIIGYIIWGVLL